MESTNMESASTEHVGTGSEGHSEFRQGGRGRSRGAKRVLRTGGRIAFAALLAGGVSGAAAITVAERGSRRFVRGAASGLAGGLAAGWLMTGVHTIWAAVEKRTGAARKAPSEGEPATVRAAEAVAGPLRGRTKALSGSLVHYAMAGITGALYGALAEAEPRLRAGAGIPYGAAVWAVADELAVPAFGLSPPPWNSHVREHARGLVAHLVYAAALAGLQRIIRRRLPDGRLANEWFRIRRAARMLTA